MEIWNYRMSGTFDGDFNSAVIPLTTNTIVTYYISSLN